MMQFSVLTGGETASVDGTHLGHDRRHAGHRPPPHRPRQRRGARAQRPGRRGKDRGGRCAHHLHANHSSRHLCRCHNQNPRRRRQLSATGTLVLGRSGPVAFRRGAGGQTRDKWHGCQHVGDLEGRPGTAWRPARRLLIAQGAGRPAPPPRPRRRCAPPHSLVGPPRWPYACAGAVRIGAAMPASRPRAAPIGPEGTGGRFPDRSTATWCRTSGPLTQRVGGWKSTRLAHRGAHQLGRRLPRPSEPDHSSISLDKSMPTTPRRLH